MLPSNIWHVKGKNQDGPNVVILGGTHGNERTGIELVTFLMRTLGIPEGRSGESIERDDVRGNLFLGFGNPEAIAKNTRYADANRKQDLNRCFAADLLADLSLDFADLRRARELVPLFQQTDLLLDIHATSSPSPPFVCCSLEAPGLRDLCRRIPTTHVVMDNDSVLGKDQPGVSRPTDYYVLKHGGSPWSMERYGRKTGLALCYETGQQTDFTRVTHVLSVLLRLLEDFGAVAKPFASAVGLTPSSERSDPLFCDLKELVPAKRAGFTYAEGVVQPWKELRKGDLIGTYADGEEERCPRDGILVFPTAESQVEAGKSLYFLMAPRP